MPIGMLMRKIQRHDAYVVMKPPSGGPTTGAMSAGQTIQPMASMIWCFGVSRSTTSRPTGDMKAAAAPWTRRDAISVQKVGLIPHSSEASVNTAIAAAKRLRASKRSLAQPADGRNTAMAPR